MKSDWEAVDLNFIVYKNTGVSILASIDDVEALLDDHIVKTATMKNSPFIQSFEKDVNEWDTTLVRQSCDRVKRFSQPGGTTYIIVVWHKEGNVMCGSILNYFTIYYFCNLLLFGMHFITFLCCCNVF